MINITIESIKKLNACKSGIEPFEKNHPDYNDSLSKLLAFDDVPYNDKIWLATRVVDIDILRQWSVECAEFVVDNYNEAYPGDTRVSDCIEMTKRYLSGDCSKEEMESAARSARSAANSAYSAYSAARSAANSAYSAANSAWSARSAARSAWSAWSAARSAAWSAAWSAESAARSAWSAYLAESAAAEKQQEDINISLLIALLED